MSNTSNMFFGKSFWKSVVGLSIAFIIVYNFIMFVFDGFSLTPLIDKATNQTTRFILANIASGCIYGFIMTFIGFRRKGKTKHNES